MPEGDTLHKVAGFMQPRMRDTTCVQAHAARSPMPLLQNRRIADVCAVGKHLIISFAERSGQPRQAHPVWHLRVHLGMTGSWHAYGYDEAWQRPRHRASVCLVTSMQAVFVCFDADDVELVQGDGLLPHSPVGRLGPDLLGETCEMPRIVARLRRKKASTPLVDTLLDQSVAAGLGNVYKSELLFLFGLHPTTCAGDITDAAWTDIYTRGRQLMLQNLGGWPRTTTYDRSQDPAGLGMTGPRLYVYRRRAEPCLTCGTPIARALMGRMLRSTYWCPACQPERQDAPS